MKNLYILFPAILLLAFWNNTANAQCNGVPCNIPDPEVDPHEACILPNPAALDCYFGATTDDAPVSFPPWCSGIHNNHWFAFVADATTTTFEICVYGCGTGSALQAAVFSNVDCNDGNWVFVSPCLGNIPTNTCQDLIASGLTIGETYYICIDGSSGAQCDYSINGVNPTVNGPTDGLCLPSNQVHNYTSNTASNWSIQPPTAGSIQGNANGVTNVNVQWFEPGPAQVCAQSIICSNAPLVCLDVFIGEDVAVTENVDVCQGKTVQCAGQNFSTAGNHFVTLNTYLGCDSVVNCFVTVIPTVHVNETHRMCVGESTTCAGEEFFSAGNFPVTLQGPSGCDSVVHCIISIIPTSLPPTKFVNLCAPAEYMVCSEIYTQTGFYETICTGFLGCDSIVKVDLAIMDPHASIAPPAVLDCAANQTVTLNGTASTTNNATGGITLYTWTGPIIGNNNQPTAVVNQPGQYCLIVQHGRGGVYCADTACVTVTASALAPGASITGGTINCVATQTTLLGSSPTNGVNYSWTGPGITPANQFLPNPTVSQLGVYVLTVTNPTNGCTSTASFTVIGDVTQPTASAIGDTITCFQPSVTIDGGTNATTPTWNWAGPGINVGNQTQENPNVLLSGTYTVTVTSTTNGCTNTATTVVLQNNANPTATAGPNDTLTCTTPNTTLLGGGDAGGQPIIFAWTGPNSFTSNIAQPNVNLDGTYILTVSNTLNGCLKKDTVIIVSDQMNPTALAGADSTINCSQPMVFLIGSASTSGPNFTATWSGPGINAGNMNQYNPEVGVPGNYTLLITNTSNGCTATDLVVVDINTALPTANAGSDQILTCTTTNGVTLSGNGNPATVTYFWTGCGIGATNETLQNPTVTQSCTYDLVVTNPANGCTATDQVIVTQDAAVPVADGGPDQVLNCSVSSVNFDGSGSSSGATIFYTWSGPGISGNNVTAQSPTGLTVPGIYNLTVTNNFNSCSITDVVVILQDIAPPTADAGNPLVLNCFNNATDTLNASGSSLGSIFTLLWSGNGINAGNQNLVNPVISNLSGTYFLTVTNTDNTCTATDQVNVSLDTISPTANAGIDKTIDCVVTSTLIGGGSSSGPNFTYLWTGPSIDSTNQSLAMPTIDLPGTYSILVTNTLNGCTASNDVLVITNAVLPTAVAGNDGLLTCANVNAILDGSASSQGPNFQVLWTGPGINAGNQNQYSPSVVDSGTYVIQITNLQNSCITRDTVVVAADKEVPPADAGINLILNCLIDMVTIDGSNSGVGPTIVYNWTGNGINGSNQNDQSPVVNQPGTYDLVVTNTANGCSDTDQALVAQDTVHPIANAGADGLINCAMVTETIDGSGSSSGAGISYIWVGPCINSSNFNLQSPTVCLSGTYTVTVTNAANNCTASDVVFIALDDMAPNIAAGPDQTLTCEFPTAQLDATPSAGPTISFLWGGLGITPGTETSATPTVTLPGMYVLTITDASNGCTNTESVNVGIDTIRPFAFAGGDMVLTCTNAATGVTLNSLGSSAGTILWTGPGITPANETLPNPTVLQEGTYTLLITDTTNGCDNTDEVVVTAQQDIPIADAGPAQIITCADTDATLDATGSTSTTGTTLQYLWNGPGINTNNQNDAMPVVILSGTYTLTVTNQGTGCTDTAQVVVSLNTTTPVVSATSDQITCLDLISTVAATSSLAGSTYFWTGPDVNTGNQNDQTLQVDLAGLYEVTVTAPNGCTSTASTTVTEDANVPTGITSGAVLNCINSGTAQISGEVLSPTGSTFTWTGPGIVGSVNTALATVSVPGTYTFTIFAPNGCVRPITAEVVADFAQPSAILVAAEEIDCNTPEVTINGLASTSGPNFSFFWTTGNGHFVSGTNTLSPIVDRAGVYQLRIVNELNGCSDSTPVTVLVDPLVPSNFNVTLSNVKCFGDVNGSIAVNGVQGGTPPFIFSLSNSSGSVINQYTGLAAGQYLLALEDANGCSLDTVLTIGEPGQLQVELGPDVSVSLGELATVTAQIESSVGVASVTWNYSPGCTDSIPYCETFTYQPFDTYRHRITVVDSNGCVDRDDVLVIVRKPGKVYVPNIFNPNSTENNIVTVFAGIDVAKINSFFIFDRWGDEVFQAIDFLPNDLSKGWDGSVRGQPGHVAVYVWYCEVEFIDGQTKLFKGDVTLMR